MSRDTVLGALPIRKTQPRSQVLSPTRRSLACSVGKGRRKPWKRGCANPCQMFLLRYEGIKQITSGPLTITFWGDFCGDTLLVAFKVENVGPSFFKFQSVSIFAIRCTRGQETVTRAKHSLI